MKQSVETTLVVVDDLESDAAVMDAAIEHTEMNGGSLLVVYVLSEDRYAGRRRTAAGVPSSRGGGHTYTFDMAVDSATIVAERIARSMIGDRDVPFTALGGPGDRLEAVRSIALSTGCSAIYLAESRSWFDRLLGVIPRRLGRGFDGEVRLVPSPGSDDMDEVPVATPEL